MINWVKLRERGITQASELRTQKPVPLLCDNCGKPHDLILKNRKKIVDNDIKYRCRSCINRSRSEQISKTSKALWAGKEYRENQLKRKNGEDYKKLQSDNTRNAWQNGLREKIKETHSSDETVEKCRKAAQDAWDNPAWREVILVKRAIDREWKLKISEANRRRWKDPKFAKHISDSMLNQWRDEEYRRYLQNLGTAQWENEEYRERMRQSAIEQWKNPEYRQLMAAHLANQSKVSSLQTILYDILDDLGVRYYREYEDGPDDHQCIVGPYNFDCVIPRDNKPDLLIECQGDYWHNKSNAIRVDKAKATYIANNFSDRYELKYIWEHEFKNHQKVLELVKYWLDLTQLELVDYSFGDLVVREAPAGDYRSLLEKYHYLPNAGRGGLAYGAYLGGDLVGVVVYSPVLRHNIGVDGFGPGEIRELSRLCIHPRYQKKNFGSWLIARSFRLLPEKYGCVISYCDTTFNHDGAVYKASNFVQDKVVPADYWYVTEDGWVMHKKTLYNHARSLKMVEREFAESRGYKRVYGSKKLRFVFKR